MDWLWVGMGGSAGAVLRYLVDLAALQWLGEVRWGTLFVNLTGSFLLGVILTISLESLVVPGHWRLFAAVGLLGSFTTFSSFIGDSWTLASEGGLPPAAFYVLGSVVPALVAGATGLGVGRWLLLRSILRPQEEEGESREDYRRGEAAEDLRR